MNEEAYNQNYPAMCCTTLTREEQAERMHAAADECMSPEQRKAFDEIGKLDPDVYARFFRCVLKRA
jgi:hypothetical protein